MIGVKNAVLYRYRSTNLLQSCRDKLPRKRGRKKKVITKNNYHLSFITKLKISEGPPAGVYTFCLLKRLLQKKVPPGIITKITKNYKNNLRLTCMNNQK